MQLPVDVERRNDSSPGACQPQRLDGNLTVPGAKKKCSSASGGPQPVEDLALATELVRRRPQV